MYTQALSVTAAELNRSPAMPSDSDCEAAPPSGCEKLSAVPKPKRPPLISAGATPQICGASDAPAAKQFSPESKGQYSVGERR